MNSRFTIAIVLLLSGVPYATFAHCPESDRECNKSDIAQMMCDCREANSKLMRNSDDVSVFLGTLVGEKLLQEVPDCNFHPQARLRKFLKKYVLNRLVVKDSVNVSLDLPSLGKVTVLNTDQFLEVALVVIHDVLAHKSLQHTAVDGLVTLTREEVVAALVWALGQTNVESILPNDLQDSRVYQETRNEVARFYVDKAIAAVR
jgi:hypothetical protein